MAQLETQYLDRQNPLTNKTYANCSAGGDSFSAGDTVCLEVKNAGDAAVTCTVATPGQVDGIDLAGYTFDVAETTGVTEVGPFPADLFGSQAQITYTAVSSLTIAVKQYGN